MSRTRQENIGISGSILKTASALLAESRPLLVCIPLRPRIQPVTSTHLTISVDVCEECIISPQSSMTVLGAKSGVFEQRVLSTHEVCATCAGTAPGEPVECVSLDCPWLYARKKAEDRVEVVETMDILMDELDQGLVRLPSISSEELSDSSQVDM